MNYQSDLIGIGLIMKESDAFEPLCNTLSSLGMHAVCIANGQYLFDGLLFSQRVCSVHKFDEFHKLMQPVIHKGRVAGRVDIVVLYQSFEKESDAKILRNMVHFAMEIKTHKELKQKNKSRHIREATIQVIGPCADNQNNSPSVILTDLTNLYYVVYLHKTDLPLNFSILVQPCSDLHSAIEFAKDKSRKCISFNFGRLSLLCPQMSGRS